MNIFCIVLVATFCVCGKAQDAASTASPLPSVTTPSIATPTTPGSPTMPTSPPTPGAAQGPPSDLQKAQALPPPGGMPGMVAAGLGLWDTFHEGMKSGIQKIAGIPQQSAPPAAQPAMPNFFGIMGR